MPTTLAEVAAAVVALETKVGIGASTPGGSRQVLISDSANNSAWRALQAADLPSHTHTLSNLTQSGATNNQVPSWNGSAWVPTTLVSAIWGNITGTLSNQTDLQTALDARQLLDATLTALAALNSTAGLLEQTGADAFTKRAIGVAAATDIPTRADADARFAALVHTHAQSDITNLVADLAVKAGTASPTFTGTVLIANGAVGTPGLAFAGSTNTGLYRSAANRINFALGGNAHFEWATNLGIMASGVNLGWASSATVNGSSLDSGLARAAAAVVRVGNGSTGAGTFSVAANSPAQITSDQNNYAPGVGWLQRWSSDASRNVTGLAAGQDGQIAEIWNVGAQNIVLQNENASSTAANRFLTSTGADLTLAPNKCAHARYDSTTARWRIYLAA